MLFALIGMSITNLQAQFYVYKEGKIIYQINDSRPDSILFEKPATPGLHGRFIKATECNESNDTNARPANNYFKRSIIKSITLTTLIPTKKSIICLFCFSNSVALFFTSSNACFISVTSLTSA